MVFAVGRRKLGYPHHIIRLPETKTQALQLPEAAFSYFIMAIIVFNLLFLGLYCVRAESIQK